MATARGDLGAPGFPTALVSLVRVIDAISEWSGRLFCWIIVPLMLGTTYEVIVRYLFNAPTIWAYDLSYMLSGSHFMLGAAYTLLKGGHIRTDIFYQNWSTRTRGWVDALLLFAPGPGGPFGMDREEYLSWLYAGGGLELYNELLQKELKMNVVVPAFTTSLPYWGPLGWFKKTFNSLDDLRKMKFRTSGLGMEMMRTMGVSVVTLAGGEVIPALERGAVDGAEWAIPGHDILMGFQNVTKNYYMPDLRQPASYQEVLINRKKWDELPKDLQAIVKAASNAEIIRMTAVSVELDSKVVEEFEKKHGVKILRTPEDVLKAQVAAIDKVYEVEAQKNPFFARVLKSQRDFAQRAVPHAQKIRPPIDVIVSHYWKK